MHLTRLVVKRVFVLVELEETHATCKALLSLDFVIVYFD